MEAPATESDASARARRHPCFDANGHGKHAGRLHLPVSPDCNIRCLFCRRGVDAGELEAPGRTRGVLPVSKAAETVRRALTICPEIEVVGVAGPGDALAGREAIEALSAVQGAFPWLLTCLSTNGLALPDFALELHENGIDFLTVTVNDVDPDGLAKICGGVRVDGRWISGPEGAALLIKRQEEGIRLSSKLGAQIKINTVVVPGVNDSRIEAIAKAVAAWGASRMNLIPLLPQCSLSHLEKPDCAAMDKAREDAGRHIQIAKRCARCRADACGVPGVSDFSGWLYGGGPGGVEFSHG